MDWWCPKVAGGRGRRALFPSVDKTLPCPLHVLHLVLRKPSGALDLTRTGEACEDQEHKILWLALPMMSGGRMSGFPNVNCQAHDRAARF